jgi:hypothetical protein
VGPCPLVVPAAPAPAAAQSADREPASAVSRSGGPGGAGAKLRSLRACPEGLLGCCVSAREARDVSAAALPRLQRLDSVDRFPVLFYAREMEDLAGRRRLTPAVASWAVKGVF